jgi:hypothetical protein
MLKHFFNQLNPWNTCSKKLLNITPLNKVFGPPASSFDDTASTDRGLLLCTAFQHAHSTGDSCFAFVRTCMDECIDQVVDRVIDRVINRVIE